MIRTGQSDRSLGAGRDALTLGQFLEEFRTDFGGWSETTWRGLSGMLRKLREEFGE